MKAIEEYHKALAIIRPKIAKKEALEQKMAKTNTAEPKMAKTKTAEPKIAKQEVETISRPERGLSTNDEATEKLNR